MQARSAIDPRTQVLILAGGRGERLSPLTTLRPKPVISFGGVFRIIDFTLSNCLNSKVGPVVLLTQYRHDELQRYIRCGWSSLWNTSFGPPPVCLPPTSGKRYRGTADAVFQNLYLIQSNSSEHALILASDHIYQMDYRALLAQHVATNADVTVATVEYPLAGAENFGVVEVGSDCRMTGFQEKPLRPRPVSGRPNAALVSMGVYAFKRGVLARALLQNCDRRGGYDFGQHVIPSMIGSARLYAYNFRDEANDCARYWRDIGTLDSYYEANMDLVRPGARFNPDVNDLDPAQQTLHPPVDGMKGARVHMVSRVRGSILSPGVRIGERAFVEDCVLMPDVHVGAGAWLRRVIVQEGVEIPSGCRIGWDLEHDRQYHTVTESGVVVVSGISRSVRRDQDARAGFEMYLEARV